MGLDPDHSQLTAPAATARIFARNGSSAGRASRSVGTGRGAMSPFDACKLQALWRQRQSTWRRSLVGAPASQAGHEFPLSHQPRRSFEIGRWLGQGRLEIVQLIAAWRQLAACKPSTACFQRASAFPRAHRCRPAPSRDRRPGRSAAVMMWRGHGQLARAAALASQHGRQGDAIRLGSLAHTARSRSVGMMSAPAYSWQRPVATRRPGDEGTRAISS